MSKHNYTRNKSRKWNQVYILPTLPSVEDLQNSSFIQYLARALQMPVEEFVNKEKLKSSPATRRLVKKSYQTFHKIDALNLALGGWMYY